MTLASLNDTNKKELARMAKEQGIIGWHAMRKDQLIRALSGAPAPAAKRSERSTSSASRPATSRPDASRTSAVIPPRPVDLPSSRSLSHVAQKDRIVTMVRDPFWLHVHWELSRSTLQRAQAALGQDWHTARPILRLFDVSSDDTTCASERQVRDIEIHGGVNNWYIDIQAPPRSYRVDVGYISRRGRFYVLARSNVVTPPRAGAGDIVDHNWASIEAQAERIYRQSGGTGPAAPTDDLRELFEERLRRPMHGLNLTSLGTGALGIPSGRKFHFEIDAELIVYGTTEPNARVTLQGEPIQVRPDGSFTVRFSLPDARQIIPATASSPDGVEERTIVLAVERNTKELEPMIHDGNEL
jgi:hypothetical protein